MGIFQADAVIKTIIELGIEDIRKDIWLMDYILENFTKIPYLKDKYGQKQIDAAKEWFTNNKIDVYMRVRDDKDQPPCVTISLGSSNEKEEMKHMADLSTCSEILLPNKIGKPIPYVVKPFVPLGYDRNTGQVQIDPTIKGMDIVVAGMILVDPTTGNGVEIIDVSGDTIIIESGLDLEITQLAVVPQFQYYKARVEHSFFQETYTIGCYAHGDPQAMLWLHSIVLYALLRYREGLLEANGFSQSTISNGDLMEDPNYSGPGGEKSYVRFISLTGMVEQSWIKSPRRFIESVVLKEKKASGFTGGIKILSNSDPDSEEAKTQQAWYPIDENADDDDFEDEE